MSFICTLSVRQNSCHFANRAFIFIFVYEYCCILIQFSPIFFATVQHAGHNIHFKVPFPFTRGQHINALQTGFRRDIHRFLLPNFVLTIAEWTHSRNFFSAFIITKTPVINDVVKCCGHRVLCSGPARPSLILTIMTVLRSSDMLISPNIYAYCSNPELDGTRAKKAIANIQQWWNDDLSVANAML